MAVVLGLGHDHPGQSLFHLDVGAVVAVIPPRAATGGAVPGTGVGAADQVAPDLTELPGQKTLVLDGWDDHQNVAIVPLIDKLIVCIQLQLHRGRVHFDTVQNLFADGGQGVLGVGPNLEVLNLQKKRNNIY